MKKFISFLLIVMMALSLCSCGLFGGTPKELKLKEDGSKISDAEDFAEWAEDFEGRVEDWEESGEMRKGKWYSVSYQVVTEFDTDEGEGKSSAKISGSFFYSPYQYEIKGSFKISGTSEYTDEDGNDVKESYKGKVVYVNGEFYSKISTKYSDDEGKYSGTDYSTDSDYVDSVLSVLELLADPTSIGSIIYVDFEEDNLWISDERIEFSAERDDDDLESLSQGIFVFEKDSIFLKSIQLYSSSSMSYDGDDVTTVSKLTIKPAITGSAKRPKDYYRYE